MQKLLLVVLLFCFCACSGPGSQKFPVNTQLKQDNVASQYFDIDTRKDTTLKTKGGATIFIPKEAIAAKDKGTSIRLELKEAYTIEDILKAGLRTKSGSRVLSSGGMMYLNADNATIQKGISVSIPSKNVKTGMQLFEGKPTEEGSIDWQNPKPAVQNSFADSVVLGKSIFNNNCASCHHPAKDATGPALAFTPQRRDKKWLKKFIYNSAALIASGDLLANCIYNEWNKTAMTAFPNLNDADLDALYAFLNEESKQLNPADYPDFNESLDSCNTYYMAKRALETRLNALKQRSGPEATLDQKNIPNTVNIPEGVEVTIPAMKDNMVVPKSEVATDYKFTINTFGWYNVDIFLDELPGFVSSNLKVSISNKLEPMYNVYLILPDDMICTDGGFMKDSKEWYAFFTDDGKIPLPQNKQAYILAFCEEEGKISFALESFKTGTDNIINLKASLITRAEMTERLKMLDFKGFTAEVKENEYAKDIKQLKVNLENVEKLKPKNSNCSCYAEEEPEMARDSTITW